MHEISTHSALEMPMSDIAALAIAYQAIVDARLVMCYQSIYNTQKPSVSEKLYDECLVRIRRPGCANLIYPGSFIPHLERTGAIRPLDFEIMRSGLLTLIKSSNTVLGVNISALSAIDDDIWMPCFKFLEEREDIARRLVVEITETTKIHPVAGRQFCSRLRELGCRVAVDDFGAGFGEANIHCIGQVDIVKIDRSALRGENGDCVASKKERLFRNVEAAQKFSSTIVVEGVETEDEFELARSSGALWVQGRYFGEPSYLLAA